jgi:aspartyl-tRNA(Asn)/glutamyl-tRNA(Gln) amidotransferase subunit C
MSTLSLEDVSNIAHLAKITVQESQLAPLKQDLENILKLVAKMDELDTTQVEPLAHPIHTSAPMREDVVTEKNQRALLQENAPAIEAGLYLVPKFVETE